MPSPTYDEVAEFVAAKDPGRRTPLLFGCRTIPGTPNAFDDWIGWFDPQIRSSFFATPGTTEPGRYWLENPARVEGTGILALGLHRDLWALGEHHRGRPDAYPAFVQVSGALVHRDNDRDGLAETSSPPKVEGVIGLNLHRANPDPKTPSTKVEKWSAACQVVAGSASLDTLLDRAKRSGLRKFDYLLVERPDR